MKIGVIKELNTEKRVAIVPSVVKRFIDMGFEVLVEKDAGLSSSFKDSEYQSVGAKITDLNEIFNSDYIFKINAPSDSEIEKMKPNSVLIAHLSSLSNLETIKKIAKKGITSYALDLMPRISRAQSMDILSSQNNLAGYRAVLDAVYHFNGVIPMMMTSAGTIPPAKIFIMGVGVSGLQAIATAKRLGAMVTAYDVRSATKEQVESLGGKFLIVDEEAMKDAQTAGGYAKEMSEDYKKKEAQAILEHIKKQDIVITTALIPGKKAPILVSKAMVEAMKQGSVIVDMATSMGGNCELSKNGDIVEHNGVKIIGNSDLAGEIGKDSSSFFAKNILNFLTPFYNKDKKDFDFNMEDELVKGTLATKNGEVVHELLKKGS